MVETALLCPAVIRTCVVGNNTLNTSQVICAIVEPARDISKSSNAFRSYAQLPRLIVVSYLFASHMPGNQLASFIGGSEGDSEAGVHYPIPTTIITAPAAAFHRTQQQSYVQGNWYPCIPNSISGIPTFAGPRTNLPALFPTSFLKI